MSLDGFNRSGDQSLKVPVMEMLAETLDLADSSDVKRALEELLAEAEAGRLTDDRLEAMESATDLMERIDAQDRPWVFAQRYLRHKFISTDPICRSCGNEVPHRTIIRCPTCGNLGPWASEEHRVASSYVHYYLAHQIKMLVESSLELPGGKAYADGMVTAIPRGGAKSTWLCEIAGLWLVLTGRSRCLLVFSNTNEQVTARCNEIKTELEENDRIIADYGVQLATKQESRTWTKSEFILPNRARVIGKGAMQSMRGVKNREYRPDVVISDDSDDDKYVTTPQQADKVWSWWDQRVIPACHPNALFMFHGTVVGELGLLWQMLSGHRGNTYKRMVFEALQDRPGCNKCGMPAPHVGPFDCPVCKKRTEAVSPCSYWGARFTTRALESIKGKIGIWAWQTEFELKPRSDSTSWFKKDWLDAATHSDLQPLTAAARRIIPWSIISVSLTGEEAVNLASMVDPRMAIVPGDYGPYQVIVQSWDPAWARATGKDQMNAWMAGVAVGLTWDDRFDVFWMDRDKGLPGTQAYQSWMYQSWRDSVVPLETPSVGQYGMIVERNSAGVLFQYGMEEHWGSVPLIDHQTGVEKHDLIDGIPGLASDFGNGKFIIRGGGSERQKLALNELIYELKNSGQSSHSDMAMALWFAWAYMKRWMKEVRDPERYAELTRRYQAERSMAARRNSPPTPNKR